MSRVQVSKHSIFGVAEQFGNNLPHENLAEPSARDRREDSRANWRISWLPLRSCRVIALGRLYAKVCMCAKARSAELDRIEPTDFSCHRRLIQNRLKYQNCEAKTSCFAERSSDNKLWLQFILIYSAPRSHILNEPTLTSLTP
jgi:hypothetical protein